MLMCLYLNTDQRVDMQYKQDLVNQFINVTCRCFYLKVNLVMIANLATDAYIFIHHKSNVNKCILHCI